MFITGIFVSIWIILFDRYYTFLFNIIFIFLFIMEIYIDCIIISIYWWFLRNNHESILWSCLLFPSNRSISSNESISKLSTIQLQNSIRRLMFLRIQNLFRTRKFNVIDHSIHHKYSLFDYRCPICFNNKQDSFQWIALGCGHILCSFCIQHLYFGNKPICPNCRSSIILSDLTILYI